MQTQGHCPVLRANGERSRIWPVGIAIATLLVAYPPSLLATIGVDWAIQTSPISSDLTGVVANGSGFVATGHGFTVTSPTGVTWTNQPQTGKNINSATHTGSKFVLAGEGAWTSTDGVTLTEVIAPVTGETLRRVIWTGDRAVAVGINTAPSVKSLIQVSVDGTTWSRPTLPVTAVQGLNGLAASGSLFVAVGDAGLVLTSVDYGISWTKRSITVVAGEHLTDAAFARGLFVVTTSKGAIWTSPNGAAWTKRKTSSIAALRRVISAGTQFIALGDGGFVSRSFGGIVWTDGATTGSTSNVSDGVFANSKLMCVGAAGTLLLSTGPEPLRPLVGFVAATSSPPESAGTVTTQLALTPASAQTVVVTLSISGSATMSAKGDYVVSTKPITFAPGETLKDLTATINQDTIDEADETAIFTLGTPTGDAALDTNTTHTITIIDDDTLPAFTAQPASSLVNVGGSVTFSATATGAPTPTALWKKNNVSQAALGTAFTANIPSAKLTDAGTWTVLASNSAGTKLSDPASLGVVDNTPKTLILPADGTATLTCTGSGTGLLYQWQVGGNDIHNTTDLRITGATTNKLVIKNANLGDAATYTCRVTMGALSVTGGTTTLDVRLFVPPGPTANPAVAIPGVSGPGASWTVRNPLPSGEDIRAMVGNTQASPAPRVIAVGAHGLILRSSDDGSTWTKTIATKPGGGDVTDDLNDVIWDSVGARYVAVGAGSTVLQSTDGITWTWSKALDSDTLQSIVFLGTRFLVVGSSATGGSAQTSPDLATWTRGVGGSTEALTDVVSAAGGSTIVAITKTNIMNGTVDVSGKVTFSKLSGLTGLTTGDSFLSLQFIGSRFVLTTQTAAGGAAKVWTSTNKTAWSQATLSGLTASQFFVRWTGSEVIGTGSDGDVWTSTNGLAWTHSATNQPGTLFTGTKSGTVGNFSFLVGGAGGRIYKTPTSAISWSSRYSTGPVDDLKGAASDGSGFLALTDGATLVSPTGVAWTRTGQGSKTFNSALWNGSLYVIVGGGAWTTPDGTSLTEVHAPASTESFNRAAMIGTKIVAVGVEPGTTPKSLIYTAATPSSWNKEAVPATAKAALRGVAGAADTFVAVGDSATILRSTNQGTTWTKIGVAVPATEHFTDVVFASNIFIACTSKGAIWTSQNGSVWTKRKASSPGALRRIIQAGSVIHAIGDMGISAWSFGGIAWADSNAGTASYLTDEAWNGSRLVAVGAGGTIVTSDTGSVSRPVLAFAAPSSAAAENAGTATININLTPASTQTVTVTCTISGTATNGAAGDFTAAPSTVTFAPGETTKPITVTIKNDLLDESDETVVLTLNTPTGDAALGAVATHTLTITDDDDAPAFTAQPISQLVPLGSNVGMSATVTGSPTPVASWKKNNATQPALGSGFSPTLNNIKLTDAGAWTVVATNTAGSKTSNIFQIGVVDTISRTVVQLADTIVTLNCPAAGNGLSYQWLLNGNPLSNSLDLRINGATTSKLVIKNANAVDAGAYACRVTQGALSLLGAPTAVNVLVSVPVVQTTVLPSTGVAQVYDFTLVATGAPNKWSATGLPAGLVLNTATGRITGQASEAGDFNITLVATNLVGASSSTPPHVATLHVNALPAAALNTFFALIDRDPATNINLGAFLQFSVATSGAVTGKLKEGTIETNFTGAITHNPGLSLATAAIALTPKIPTSPTPPAGLPVPPPVTLNLSIDLVTGDCVGSLATTASSLPFSSTRANQWAAGAPAVKQGRYNFVIKPPAVVSPELTRVVPVGYGYGTFSVGNDGAYTATGKTADGRAWSVSSVLTSAQQIAIYGGFYNTLGSLQGLLDLTDFPGLVYVAPPVNLTGCTATVGSNTITCNSTAGLKIGMAITSIATTPGAPKITAITNSTTFVISGTVNSGAGGTGLNLFASESIVEVKVSGNLTWMRKPETAPRTAAELVRERNYRDSFQFGLFNSSTGFYDPLTLAADGGFYFVPAVRTIAPTLTGVLMNRPASNNNAHILFLYASLPNPANRTDPNNDPDSVLTLDVPDASHLNGVFNISNANTHFTVDLATGIFSGDFDHSDPNPLDTLQTIQRLDTPFFGMVIRQFITNDTAIQQRGFGFFSIPDLPRAGEGVGSSASDMTNSSILSGQVQLGP